MAVDEGKLDEFLGRAIGVLGAAMSAVLVQIGDELGLVSRARAGPMYQPPELAEPPWTVERYVREWLANQGRRRFTSRRRRSLLPQRGAGALPGPIPTAGRSARRLLGGRGPVPCQGARRANFRTVAGMDGASTDAAVPRH